MMKSRVVGGAILTFVVLAFVFPPAAGYNVTSVHVDPSGVLIPGTPVTATFKVGWDAGSGEPFPSENVLDLTTDLADPRWTHTPLCDAGPDTSGTRTGSVGFDAYEPYCPDGIYESVRVTLEGITPDVDKTDNRTIISVHEKPDSCARRTCFSYTYTALVINVGNAAQKITETDERLREFRSHIEENTSRGIDTSAAEAKYNLAQQKIASSEARLPTQYPEAFYDLNIAHTAIDEGETALDKAWAESEIATARVPVANTDAVIRWFKGNTSTAAEPGLDQVIAKRDIAAKYLDAAGDELARGNFSGARADAREAYRMGNESYHDAVGLQTETVCGPGCGFPFVPIVTGIGAIIIAIGAFFLWKKRK